ncbi:MAG: GPO family capsid scaffolding protein [Robiginitomaculum sp.]|nr:GPO family capsid scaffolding protein [Robiginitomaculum sp.]
MTKPNLITKFFRIATSGKTVDGRTIDDQDIDDMAETYDPEEYTALVNYEHFRFLGNFGKVVALKVDTDKKNRRTLYAQLSPNKRLLDLNGTKQKLFTSMEITKNFAGTGKAYLVGLAVTDSPASLGVEALCFSANNDGPGGDRFKNNLFSEKHEMEQFTMEKEDKKTDDNTDAKPAGGDGDQKPEAKGFLQKFKERLKPVQDANDDQFSALEEASIELAQKYSDMSDTIAELQAANKTLTDDFAAQEETITKLTAALENTPEDGALRPSATGQEDENLADC